MTLGTLHGSTITNTAKILLALTQNHLFWTGRSDREAIAARLSGRLHENEESDEVAAVYERRRQIQNSGTYTDDPDGQTIAGAADNEEANGVHGSNVLA